MDNETNSESSTLRVSKPLSLLQHNNLLPKHSPSPKNSSVSTNNNKSTRNTNDNKKKQRKKQLLKTQAKNHKNAKGTTSSSTANKNTIPSSPASSWIISPTAKALLKCLHIFATKDGILDSKLYKSFTFNSLKDGQILSKILQCVDGDKNVSPYKVANNSNNKYKGRRHTISELTATNDSNDKNTMSKQITDIYEKLQVKLQDTPSYLLFATVSPKKNNELSDAQANVNDTLVQILEMLAVYIVLYSPSHERYVAFIMNELDINTQTNMKLILEKYYENNISCNEEGEDENDCNNSCNSSILDSLNIHNASSVNNGSSTSFNVSLNLSMDTPCKNRITHAKTIVDKLIVETTGSHANSNSNSHLLYTPSPIALSMSSHNLNRSDNSDLDAQVPRKSTVRQRRARQALQAQTPSLSDLSNDSMFDSPSVTERKELRKNDNVEGEIKSYKSEIKRLKEEIKLLKTKSTRSTRLERENIALKDELQYLQNDLVRVSDECLQFKQKYEDLHKQIHEQALNNVDTISSIEMQFTNTVKDLKQQNKNLNAELNRVRRQGENMKSYADELDELRTIKAKYEKVNVSAIIIYFMNILYSITNSQRHLANPLFTYRRN